MRDRSAVLPRLMVNRQWLLGFPPLERVCYKKAAGAAMRGAMPTAARDEAACEQIRLRDRDFGGGWEAGLGGNAGGHNALAFAFRNGFCGSAFRPR